MKATGKGDSAAAGGYWLEKNNSEYDQVHYYLKACVMDQGEINKLEIWKIENLDMTFRYERKSSNVLKLATWTSTKGLPGDNTVEGVCNHGFSFEKTLNNGAEFVNGVIDFNTNRSEDIALNKDYSFIYSEIAVGRSFVYDNDLRKRQPQPCVPVGYDSLYLPANPLDRDNNGEFSLQEYHLAANFDNRDPRNYCHKYFIQDPLQVLPKYIVRFKLNTSPNYGIPAPEDTEEIVYYDTTSFAPLTKAQRNNINYAAGNTNIQPIEVSFNTTVENHHQADPMVESKKLWLDRQLESVEDKVREVNLNYAEISEAIAETAAKAIANLQALTKTKLQTCLSIEIELRRQQEQLQWLDIAINSQLASTSTVSSITAKNGSNVNNYSAQNRKKLDFLKSYKYHSMFRNTLSRSKPNEIMLLNTIHADIKIAPDIKIYLDPFYSHSHETVLGSSTGGDGSSTAAAGGHPKDSFAAYTSEFHQQQHFSAPARTEFPLVAGSIQSLINSEMESISTALQAAMNAPGIPLPDSLLKPLISGERYEPPLHDILRGFENDFAEGQAVGGGAKENFNAALKNSLGAPPQFAAPSHQVPYYMQQHQDHVVPAAVHHQDDHHSTGASTLNYSASQSHHSQVSSPRAQQHHHQHEQQQHAPYSRTTPHKNVRSSVLMLPPSAAGAAGQSGNSVVSEHTNRSPLQSPTSGAAVAARSASPVANDRLFHSATQDGQLMKSLTAHEDPSHHHNAHDSHHQGHAEESDLDVHMSVNALVKVIANNFTQYSLSDISNRKKRQLIAKSITSFSDAVDALTNQSRVLGGDKTLSERVYFNLPFFAKPPQVKLLYTTDFHSRSMEDLFQKTLKHRGSSIILIRSGEFLFGAYLSHPLTPTCQWTGSPACYLFSLTLDVKLPYHARVANQAEFAHVSTPLAYYIQSDSFFIGNGDLSFDADLTNGSSELENCYGVGLEVRSKETLCLLAGSPLFTIDEMEVWGVTMN